jgi:hypothetical protein
VKRDLADVVDTGQKDQRPSGFRQVTVPYRGHKAPVMAGEVVIKQLSGDVSGVHEVLRDGQPIRRISLTALGPEGTRQFGEN